jgi:hypothetical protein
MTKPKKRTYEPDDPKQSERFIAMAREIGADETAAGARRALQRLKLTKKKSAKRARAKR